jgi:hypothetical protein
MVETIAPVVYGRRSSYLIAAFLHTIAATVTAGLTGALLGLVGMIATAPWGDAGTIVVAAVAFLYALREIARVPVPLPNARRQVPEWWRTFFSPWVAAILYGAGLGVAFVTFLSFGTFVAVAAGAVVSGDPLLGAALCAPFGLARGVSVTIVGLASRTLGESVDEVARLGATPVPRVLNGAVLALVGAAAVVGAL